jgi:hypothetical protein
MKRGHFSTQSYVVSPTIKIFHRHLGPNLLIFAVKVSPWFHRHFTVILWHITDISPRKNTDQGKVYHLSPLTLIKSLSFISPDIGQKFIIYLLLHWSSLLFISPYIVIDQKFIIYLPYIDQKFIIYQLPYIDQQFIIYLSLHWSIIYHLSPTFDQCKGR